MSSKAELPLPPPPKSGELGGRVGGPGPGDEVLAAFELIVIGDNERREVLDHGAGVLDVAFAAVAAGGDAIAAGAMADVVGGFQLAENAAILHQSDDRVA